MEGVTRKNIIQIAHYPYLIVYSWLIDLTTLYMDYVYTSKGTPIYPSIYLHSFFMIFEVIYTFKHIKDHREEYNLKYFRKFGASLEFNRTNCKKEKLMLCLRFNIFSQYIVAVHYFLDVYVEDKVIVSLMFIGQIHLGIVNMSYSVFKKIECKKTRLFQMMNLFLAIFIRFLQLVIVIQSTTTFERLNFYSIFGVEITTLIMMIYMSYVDFLNFGVDLISN
jgi:hypothetical protein